LHPRTRQAVDKEQAGVVPEIFAFFPVIPIFLLETFDADADGLLYLGYTSMDATGMDMEILALQTV
jgi:hypothetical protein